MTGPTTPAGIVAHRADCPALELQQPCCPGDSWSIGSCRCTAAADLRERERKVAELVEAAEALLTDETITEIQDWSKAVRVKAALRAVKGEE